MSNPESPTVRGSSNSARIPVSLTSRQNPRKGEPPAIKFTGKPVVVRGSRYTNLRILSKSLIPVSPAQAEQDRHANPGNPSYVSARCRHPFKESTSARYPPYPSHSWIATVAGTRGDRETR